MLILSIAGLILCGLAGAGFLMMITVLGVWWPVGLLGPAVPILVGLVVLAWGMARYLFVPRAALERGGDSLRAGSLAWYKLGLKHSRG